MLEPYPEDINPGHIRKTRLRQKLTKCVFNEDYGIKHELPEHTLWAAVLVRAMADWIRLTKNGSYSDGNDLSDEGFARELRTLKRYFLDEDDDIGSFLWACQMISETPEGLCETIRLMLGVAGSNGRSVTMKVYRNPFGRKYFIDQEK